MDTSKLVSLFDGQVDVKFHATGHKYFRRVNDSTIEYHDPSTKQDVSVDFPKDEIGKWIKLGGKSASVISKAALDKPELYNWFTDVAVNEFKRCIERGMDIDEAEGSAKGIRWKKFKAGGQIGTDIHEFINNFILAKMEGKKSIKLPTDISKESIICCKKFIEWQEVEIKEFIESEFIVYDPELDVVGTTDIVAINKTGKLWVYDAKSGARVYPADVMQLGFYRKGYALHCGKFPDGASILHFEDKNKIHEYKNLDHEANAIAFQCAVYLYNWRKSLNV